MKRVVLSLAVSMTLALSCPPAWAQGKFAGVDDLNVYSYVEALFNVVRDEIARDEEIISSAMNIQRLRDTRKKIAKDLPKKEEALAPLKESRPPELESAISAVEKTAKDERRIAESGRRTNPEQRRTYMTIKENLPEKRKALEKLDGWLKGSR